MRNGWSIVLAILLIVIAVIVVPNILRARMSPGEATFVGNVRTINTAEIVYAAKFPKTGFSPTLAALGGGSCSDATEQRACLIDDALASGVKGGYRYRYTPVRQASDGVIVGYVIHADASPEPPSWLERIFHIRSEPGQRHLYSDQTGVIRSEMGREANEKSTPL